VTAPESALLTQKDVAARLNVTTRTVRNLQRNGWLPVVHLGAAVRYRPEDVEALIDRNRRLATEATDSR
jgi:excisionase family DNA binding protein